MTENNQQPGSADQARKCELRLCNADDNHAPGCNTYDPERTRDREWDAAPSPQIEGVAELPSIDTPEFRELLFAVWNGPTPRTYDRRVTPLVAHIDSKIRDAIAASRRAAPTATHGPLSLTNRKTADIAGRGYNIVGYVLRSEGGEEVCISAESAVRWLPQAHYWRLMHEQDGSLFAASLPDVAMPEHVRVALELIANTGMDARQCMETAQRALAAQPAEGSAQVAVAEQQDQPSVMPPFAAPASQHDASAGETLDQKAENALLWCYRRLKNSYGRLPFVEEAVAGLRERTRLAGAAREGGNTCDKGNSEFAAEGATPADPTMVRLDESRDAARYRVLRHNVNSGHVRITNMNPTPPCQTDAERIDMLCDQLIARIDGDKHGAPTNQKGDE